MTVDEFFKKYKPGGSYSAPGGGYKGECVSLVKLYIKYVLGAEPKSIGNGKEYYNFDAHGTYLKSLFTKYTDIDNFQPKKGDVFCRTSGTWGHVGVVYSCSKGKLVTYEQYGGNGDHKCHKVTRTSWGNLKFLRPKNQNNIGDDDNKLTLFIAQVLKHINEGPKWTKKQVSCPDNQSWDAAYILACARVVKGITGKVIYNNINANEMPRGGVDLKYGTWVDGPCQKKTPLPKVGDIVAFRNKKVPKNADQYYCDHVGVVVDVNSKKKTFHVVEGDCSNKVVKNSYKTKSGSINGYYRPNWKSIIDTDPDGSTTNYYTNKPLYNTENTREDASVREVAYIDNKNKPSIKSTDVKLSTINYTDLMSDMWDVVVASMGGDPPDGSDPPTTKLEGSTVPKKIINYLVDKGLNNAAAVGIIANIYYESGFKTDAVGDNGTSFGICQWHLGRGKAMKKMAGKNWKNNLSGQLDYLWSELKGGYKSSVLNYLKDVSNNKSGAQNAAERFCRKFEVPDKMETRVSERRAKAASYWDNYFG